MARRIAWCRIRGKHHGDVDISREMGQPFSVTRIGKAGEVEGMLVGGCGNDGVHFALKRQFDGGLDRVSGNAAGADHAIAVGVAVAQTKSPGSYRDTMLSGNRLDLVFGTDNGDLCIDGLNQRSGGDLRPDPARIAEGYSEPRT
jgi:hypothetical protein